MKEEIKNITLGSSCTVGSEATTGEEVRHEMTEDRGQGQLCESVVHSRHRFDSGDRDPGCLQSFVGRTNEQEPRHSTIAGDLNVELGLLCTDDDEVEELNEMYGPLRWQACDNDQGGIEKLMWYEIMNEFICKVTSTRSSCDREREIAFMHRLFLEGWKRKDDAAGLHHRAQRGRRIRLTYTMTVRFGTHGIHASIHEDDAQNYFSPYRREIINGQDGCL